MRRIRERSGERERSIQVGTGGPAAVMIDALPVYTSDEGQMLRAGNGATPLPFTIAAS